MKKLLRITLVLVLVLVFSCLGSASAQTVVSLSWNFAVDEYKPTLTMKVGDTYKFSIYKNSSEVSEAYKVSFYSKTKALTLDKITGEATAVSEVKNGKIAAIVKNTITGNSKKIWAFVTIENNIEQAEGSVTYINDIYTSTVTEYNSNGVKVNVKEYYDNGGFYVESGSNWELSKEDIYDEAGKLVKTYMYFDNELLREISYEYNSDGNVTKQNCSDGSSCEYIYNDKGYLIEQIDSEYDYVIHTVYEYEFYDNGNIKKMTMSNNPMSDSVLVSEYDENGLKLSEKRLFYSEKESALTDEEFFSIYYEYDANGNLTRMTEYASDRTSKMYDLLYEYDEKNRLIKESQTEVSEQKDPYETTFEYDSFGNLYRRINIYKSMDYDIYSEIVYTQGNDGSEWQKTMMIEDGQKTVYTYQGNECIIETVPYEKAE